MFIYCASVHVRTYSDHYDRWSIICLWISFHDLYFYSAFINYLLFRNQKTFELDLSFSRHCTRRKKRLRLKETRKIFHRGGFWIIQSMGSHSHYYFVTMLVFNICSCSIFLLFWSGAGSNVYVSLFLYFCFFVTVV